MMEITTDVHKRIMAVFDGKVVNPNIDRVSNNADRYIQISTALEPSSVKNVHYELYQGRVELHFEEYCFSSDDNIKGLIKFLKSKTENDNAEGDKLSVWEEWKWGYRYQYKEVDDENYEIVLKEFIGRFDDLIIDYCYDKSGKYCKVDDYVIKDDGIKETDVDLHIMKLGEVLGLTLRIPFYQRTYCWDERNVNCLLDDIRDHINDIRGHRKKDCKYRLGSIILHRNRGEDGNIYYDVIDGQQRLVTLAMLLLEFGTYSKLLREKFDSKTSRQYIGYNKGLVHTFYERLRKEEGQDENLNSSFSEYILDKIDFSVLVLKSSSMDLAFTFFSNQNSRGVALTDYDLLKAHHLRHIPHEKEEEVKDAAEGWNSMIEEGRRKGKPDYVRLLDTYIYRLRRWMQNKKCEEGTDDYHIKLEYEAAPTIKNLPQSPSESDHVFYETIQGGTSFFSFVRRYLDEVKRFSDTDEYKALNNTFGGAKSTDTYRDVIEAISFAYYLKFGELYLADAIVVIMRFILQHRYWKYSSRTSEILKYVYDNESENENIVLMLVKSTSPAFFFGAVENLVRRMYYPGDMGGIRMRTRGMASVVANKLKDKIKIESFKKFNA